MPAAGRAHFSSCYCSFVGIGAATGAPVCPEVQAEGLVGASKGTAHIGTTWIASEGRNLCQTRVASPLSASLNREKGLNLGAEVTVSHQLSADGVVKLHQHRPPSLWDVHLRGVCGAHTPRALRTPTGCCVAESSARPTLCGDPGDSPRSPGCHSRPWN